MMQHGSATATATNSSRRGGRGSNNTRGGRGRGRGGGGGDTTFVSATGDPIAGTRSCFLCGDPSHFANACPNRGM